MSWWVPMKTETQTSWFAPLLQQAMNHKGMSVRRLAQVWRPDENIETSRRSLNRYLHQGVVPGETIRRELASAVDVPAEHFLGGPGEPGPFRRAA